MTAHPLGIVGAPYAWRDRLFPLCTLYPFGQSAIANDAIETVFSIHGMVRALQWKCNTVGENAIKTRNVVKLKSKLIFNSTITDPRLFHGVR